ncbi:MAG: ribulokinase, partial [Salinicola sp.]|uniref:FGGY family carbohydrate kinase n=1 Tax=Salinicola sp. TaxID=1978524 RepID=UPI001DBBCB6F
MTEKHYSLGVDIGTGSARVGVFDDRGELLGEAKAPIALHRPLEHHVEQSTSDIWRAVCDATRRAVDQAGIEPARVKSLSVSATCSLVLLDRQHEPLALSPGGERW